MKTVGLGFFPLQFSALFGPHLTLNSCNSLKLLHFMWELALYFEFIEMKVQFKVHKFKLLIE